MCRVGLVMLVWLMVVGLGTHAVWATPAAPWAETVISPRKMPESRLTATRSVTVITRQDLERWGTPFVADALRHIAGVYVRRSGGIGRVTNAVIRGSSAAHILVLLDGVQVNSPTTGAFDLGHLTTDNIDRIEVLRGGASTLYGSEAVGGVIQIFTKDGAGPTGGLVAGEFGSDRTFHERGEVHASSDRTRFSGTVSRMDSNGVSAQDDYRNVTYSARSLTRLANHLDLDTAVRFHEGRVGIDDGAFKPDPNRRNTEQLFTLGGTLRHQITTWWQQRVQFGLNRNELVDLDQPDPGTAQQEVDSRLVTNLASLEWRHDVDWAEWGGIGTGFEVKDQRGSNANFDKSLFTWAWYVQPHLTLWERLTLVAGTRLFRHNTFGRGTTWEASAAYRFGDRGPKLRGGYARGYHAPTLNDLYFPNFSNPQLQPETSGSYEVGLDHAWWDGRLTGSTSLFQRNVTNLIQFTGLTPVNIGKTKQRGAEVEFAADLGHGFSLESHYTYTDARERPSKEELLRIPHQTIGCALRYVPVKPVAVDLRYEFVGSREEVGRQKLERYDLIDIGLTVQVREHLELYTRVENLLGRHYQEIIGFPSSRAQVFFGGRVWL